MKNIMFKKCKENMEMLNSTNMIFKDNYLIALNNIEENFYNYSSIKALLQEMYKLSIYGLQRMVDPRMEEQKKIYLLTKISKTSSTNEMDEYLNELKSLNELLISIINEYFDLIEKTKDILF